MIDNASYRVLKTLYKINSVPEIEIHKITGHKDLKVSDPIVSALLSDGLIKLEPGETHVEEGGNLSEKEGTYKITINGRAYVDQRNRDLFNFWVPYILTTVIAIASLLVAIAGFQQNVPPVENSDTLNPSRSPTQIFDCDTSGR